MGTTAQKLQAIQNSKAAIKAAIEAKGVSNVGDVLSQYATKIASIPSGGSSGDPRYEVNGQGQLVKKNFALNYFNDVTSIPANGLEYAYWKSNVTSVSFPNLTSVGASGLYNAFNGCTSLKTVLLKKLSSANNSFTSTFLNCTALELVDFSEATAVPALNNVNAFLNTNSTFKIVVPDDLYSSWTTASNWSNFANQIVKVSDYTS